MSTSSIPVPAAQAAFTSNGTSAGVVTVASTTPFYVGAECYIYSTGVASATFKITAITSSTTLTVQKMVGSPYGGGTHYVGNGSAVYTNSDVSGYTTAQTATIAMPAQVVPVPIPPTTITN